MIRHTLLYLIARLGTGVLAIASLAVFTRLLSPAEYGMYVLGVASATICSAVFFQWLAVSVSRFYARYCKQPRSFFGAVSSAYWISALAAAVLALSVVVACAFGLVALDITLVIVILALMLAQGRYDVALQLANARGEPARFAMASWLRSAAALVVGSAFVLVWGGAVAALAGAAIGCIVAARFPQAADAQAHGGAPIRGLPGELLRYGAPLAFNSLALMVVGQSDRVLIATMLGVAAVGPYAAAYDFAQQSIGAIMNVFFLAAYPAIVRTIEEQGPEGTREQLQKLARAYVTVGFAATAGLTAVAGDVAAVFFGESFRQEAAMVIPWVALAIFVSGLKAFYLDLPFQLKGKTQHQAYIAVFMATVNVLLNLVLLPRHGIRGAAIAGLSAFVLGAAASWWGSRQIMRLPNVWRDAVKSAVGVAFMLLVLAALPRTGSLVSLVLAVCVGACSYALAAFVLDLGEFRSLLRLVPAVWRVRTR